MSVRGRASLMAPLGVLLLAACGHPENGHAQTGRKVATGGGAGSIASAVAPEAAAYTGHDANGIPHYARRALSDEERALLRQVYGVEDPSLLYVSDSTDDGLLKYDTRAKPCATCYVNSYRIGFVSMRRPGESWNQLERR